MKGPEGQKYLHTRTGNEFLEKRQKEVLPVEEVDNEVEWLNPAFTKVPFRLEQGHRADLGVFLTKKTEEKKRRLGIIMPEAQRGRSVLIESILFQDDDGNIYRDVDLKGSGYFYKTEAGKYIIGTAEPRENNEVDGLIDREDAEKDRDYAEKFIRAGIRTHRVIAIIELKEIRIGDETISIDEAVRRNIIPYNFDPVIQVRAFGTKERIDYLYIEDAEEEHRDRARHAVKDAMNIVAQELHRDPSSLTIQEYLKWFTKTLGTQIAKLKKIGVRHGGITSHNVTLDCWITDHDNADSARMQAGVLRSEDDIYRFEYKNGLEVVRNLNESILSIFGDEYKLSNDTVEENFSEAYELELKTK